MFRVYAKWDTDSPLQFVWNYDTAELAQAEVDRLLLQGYWSAYMEALD